MAYGVYVLTGDSPSVAITMGDEAPGLFLEEFVVPVGTTVSKDYSATPASFLSVFYSMECGWDDALLAVVNQPVAPTVTINQSARTVSITNPSSTGYNEQSPVTILVFGS